MAKTRKRKSYADQTHLGEQSPEALRQRVEKLNEDLAAAERRSAALTAWAATHLGLDPTDSDISLAARVLGIIKLGRHAGQPAAPGQPIDGQTIYRPTPKSHPPTGGDPRARDAVRQLTRTVENATNKADRRIHGDTHEADSRCWKRTCVDAVGIPLQRGHLWQTCRK
ncbi:MAG: hypothetical protein GEU73_07805 [Chloroflexi bacterium]|nr:hypothetical protein [Chloroflexota bacterium]